MYIPPYPLWIWREQLKRACKLQDTRRETYRYHFPETIVRYWTRALAWEMFKYNLTTHSSTNRVHMHPWLFTEPMSSSLFTIWRVGTILVKFPNSYPDEMEIMVRFINVQDHIYWRNLEFDATRRQLFQHPSFRSHYRILDSTQIID